MTTLLMKLNVDEIDDFWWCPNQGDFYFWSFDDLKLIYGKSKSDEKWRTQDLTKIDEHDNVFDKIDEHDNVFDKIDDFWWCPNQGDFYFWSFDDLSWNLVMDGIFNDFDENNFQG